MNDWIVYIVLLLAQFAGGGFYVIVILYGKNTDTDPMVLVLIRDFFAAVITLILTFISEKKLMIPKRSEIHMFILMGLFGNCLARIGLVWGVYFTSASISAMFQPTVPVWVYLFAMIFRIEKFPDLKKVMSYVKPIGVLLAVVGAITMCFGNDSGYKVTQESWKQAVGYIILLVNVLSSCAFILLQKKFIFSVDISRWKKMPFNVVTWNYIFGWLFILLGNLYNIIAKPGTFTELSIDSTYAIAYGCLVNSVGVFSVVTWANSKIKSSMVSCSWICQTFSSIILSYFFLTERLGGFEIGGGVLIIVAMGLVVWSNYREEKLEANNNNNSKRDQQENSEKHNEDIVIENMSTAA